MAGASSHPLTCVCGAVARFQRQQKLGYARLRIACSECLRTTRWEIDDQDGIAKHELAAKWQNWVEAEQAKDRKAEV